MRIAATLFLLLASPALPQSTIPDTPAGTVLRSWLDAFNSGDRARIKAYLAKYDPVHSDDVDRTAGLRERTGGFKITRIGRSEPLHVEAFLEEQGSHGHAQVSLDVSDANPPQVTGMMLRPASRIPDQLPRVSLNEAIAAVDKEAAESARTDQFSGAVLIARGPNVLFEKPYGFADRTKHIKAAVDTRFRIGSMNKMFTATAILQLAGEGKIDLAAPLGRYLPDYPNHDVATKVTIRHLLTHTGGTGDIFTPEYEQHRLDTRRVADYIKLFGSRALKFEPGTKWSYSNYGFILLGAVIESVSKVPYDQYVREHIFEPAGMLGTGSLPETDQVSNRSIGYTKENGAWVSNVDSLPWSGSPAGGGYSTVEDLYHFATALLTGKLIKPDLFEAMTSKQAGDRVMGPGEGYGFGMLVSDDAPGKRFGHGGGAPGQNGELRVYPRSGTIVVVLANLDPPAATTLADLFDQRMPAEQ